MVAFNGSVGKFRQIPPEVSSGLLDPMDQHSNIMALSGVFGTDYSDAVIGKFVNIDRKFLLTFRTYPLGCQITALCMNNTSGR